MTMQQPEQLLLEGEEYPLLDRPLEQCLVPAIYAKVQSIIQDPRMLRSSLSRNYLGHWRVDNGDLLLDDVHVLSEEHLASIAESHPKRGLAWLFPDASGPVAATWVNGTLRLGDGEVARAMYRLEWSIHIVLTLHGGKVTQCERQSNEEAFEDCRRVEGKLHRRLDGL